MGTDSEDGIMFLLGVVSSGTPKCGQGKPGIYTRAANYAQWIKNSIRP